MFRLDATWSTAWHASAPHLLASFALLAAAAAAADSKAGGRARRAVPRRGAVLAARGQPHDGGVQSPRDQGQPRSRLPRRAADFHVPDAGGAGVARRFDASAAAKRSSSCCARRPAGRRWPTPAPLPWRALLSLKTGEALTGCCTVLAGYDVKVGAGRRLREETVRTTGPARCRNCCPP